MALVRRHRPDEDAFLADAPWCSAFVGCRAGSTHSLEAPEQKDTPTHVVEVRS